MGTGKVLAMYDVRGIQDYIFHTSDEKDAIGASLIVKDIIKEALEYAVVKKKGWMKKEELEWDGHKYIDSDKKAQVLYIGGGNAYVIYDNEDDCLDINKIMSKYVIENTYSLQLATAWVNKTDDYQKDTDGLKSKMDSIKAKMIESKPLGALPIMEVQEETGYPVTFKPIVPSVTHAGTESRLKKDKEREDETRSEMRGAYKKFDSYVTQKGINSTIAVVHIDGNNMGLRIRQEMKGIKDYEAGVNKMREISHNIAHSYENVFEEMAAEFNQYAGRSKEFSNKKNNYFVLKILVAGDDITYICNGEIALETVNYFCQRITKKTMAEDKEQGQKSNFSACAGIAFMNSHFPFNVGYDVAEACCKNAKSYAKAFVKDKKRGYKIQNEADGDELEVGNWVDFQICQNIQARDLGTMREREYYTSHGEQLLRRPYCIYTEETAEQSVPDNDSRSYESLKKNILYFQDEKHIPRTFAKQLRNIYPQGESRVNDFNSLLESRGWKMPDGSNEFYEEDTDMYIKTEKIAKWYDALEMLDYFVNFDFKKEKDDEQISNEN